MLAKAKTGRKPHTKKLSLGRIYKKLKNEGGVAREDSYFSLYTSQYCLNF